MAVNTQPLLEQYAARAIPEDAGKLRDFLTRELRIVERAIKAQALIPSRVIEADVLATIADGYLAVDATDGAVTVRLPDVGPNTNGRIYYIKKTDASANAVTIEGNDGALIDGSATLGLTTQNQSAILYPRPNRWDVLSQANIVPAGTISGSGTINTLAMFTAATVIGDSLLSQSGSTMTLNGNFVSNATGTRTVGSVANEWLAMYTQQVASIGQLTLLAGGAAAIVMNTAGAARWLVNTSGHTLWSTDNTLDIGASGATRPRTGYFGTSVIAPTGTFTNVAGTLTTASQPNVTTMTNLTTIGTLVAGAVPLSLVTAGTSPAGTFIFPTIRASVAITPVTTDTTVLGTSGNGFVELWISHNSSRASGLNLVQTLAGQGSPRLMFSNTTSWPGAGNTIYQTASNQLTFTTGGTPGSASGTSRWGYNASGIFPATTDAMAFGNSSFEWSDVRTVLATISSTLTQNGTTAALVQGASGNLNVGASTSTESRIRVNGAVGTLRQYVLETAGSFRWNLYASTAAESGSNAGSAFSIGAYSDAGSFIENVLVITRAAAGTIAFLATRPITGGTYNGQTVSSAAAFTGTMTIATSLVIGVDPGSSDMLRVGGTVRANGFTNTTSDIVRSVTNGLQVLSGGTTISLGANVRVFGQTHATQADDIEFRSSATVKGFWDFSALRWTFSDAMTISNGLTVSASGIAVTGNSTITGTLGSITDLTAQNVFATTRVTSPLLGTTTAVDVVFDRNSVTQLTLGSLAATFAGTVAGTAFSGTSWTGTGLIQTTLTTEQMRLRYDASNYLSVTVGSTGLTTIASTGSASPRSITFSNDNLKITSPFGLETVSISAPTGAFNMDIRSGGALGTTTIYGGSTTSSGYIILNGASVSDGQDIIFHSASTVRGRWDHSAVTWIFDNNFVINEAGGNFDTRIEGDVRTHTLFLDASEDNLALCAASAPAWNSMQGGTFLADRIAAPTGNPTAGGYLYSESGALKWRGSGGTTTTLALA